MDVLWQRRSGTVQQVLDNLPPKLDLAYNSVLTTIRILEKKGYLGHKKDGRAHVYVPIIQRVDATRNEISNLVSRFFRNSHEQLVFNILEERGIDSRELDRLKEMLEINKTTPGSAK